MQPALLHASEEKEVLWGNTIRNGSWRSRDFFLVAVYNFLVLLNLLLLYRDYGSGFAFSKYVGIFILAILFLVSYAGHYFSRLYRTTQHAVLTNTSPEASALIIKVSYFAYRLYLIGLLLVFLLLASANAAHPH